jgi:hypothetical protein
VSFPPGVQLFDLGDTTQQDRFVRFFQDLTGRRVLPAGA